MEGLEFANDDFSISLMHGESGVGIDIFMVLTHAPSETTNPMITPSETTAQMIAPSEANSGAASYPSSNEAGGEVMTDVQVLIQMSAEVEQLHQDQPALAQEVKELASAAASAAKALRDRMRLKRRYDDREEFKMGEIPSANSTETKGEDGEPAQKRAKLGGGTEESLMIRDDREQEGPR
jgi:hypothetical protein